MGDVAFQYLEPLDQVVSLTSKPPFDKIFCAQLSSFEPQDAYPMTLEILVKNTDVSSKTVGKPSVWFRVVFAT